MAQRDDVSITLSMSPAIVSGGKRICEMHGCCLIAVTSLCVGNSYIGSCSVMLQRAPRNLANRVAPCVRGRMPALDTVRLHWRINARLSSARITVLCQYPWWMETADAIPLINYYAVEQTLCRSKLLVGVEKPRDRSRKCLVDAGGSLSVATKIYYFFFVSAI